MLSRSFRVIRPTQRLLTQSVKFYSSAPSFNTPTAKKLADVTGKDSSLIGKGAQPGTIPTDLDQATGLQRFEELGKREGIDVFDMENPITEGKGTMADPFLVPSYTGERVVGCIGGKKGDEEHDPFWMRINVNKEGRCWRCGNVYAINYLGEPGAGH